MLLFAGEEKFVRSRVVLEKERCPAGSPMCCVWSRCMEWAWRAADASVVRKPNADAEY